jgi:RNA polymerase sigma-70 factor (ECF subfamily)
MTSMTDAGSDQAAFTAALERHRREMHVHCYRMLGSFDESEDLVQETFLRAWRRRDTLEERASLRAWLYRIATNACLDALDKRPRTPTATGEVPWLQPYPDAALDELASGEDPAAATVAKETIELAFLVAIQHLAPLQRAVLILRDVLGLSAKETATTLETTVPAVNSALQRAHAAMREHLPAQRTEWSPGTAVSAAERALVERYVECSENADPDGFKDVLSDDLRFTMPPQPGVWEGRETVVQAWVNGGFGSEPFGSMHCVVTRANRQPAVACYVRRPGDDLASALAVDLLRFEGGAIAEIVVFDESRFAALGLPETLAP